MKGFLVKLKRKISRALCINRNMNITLINIKRSIEEVTALLNAGDFPFKPKTKK